MTSMSRALVLLLLAIPSHDAIAQQGPLWRTLDVSRQLRDSLPKRVRLQYDAGTLDVRGTSDPLLYAMHLRYDETRAEPLHRFDAAEQLAVLGLRSLGRGMHVSSGEDRGGSGELKLALPRVVPLDVELELGGTRSTLELGDLSLRSLRLECGATDAQLSFSLPNRVAMRDIQVDVGAADFLALNLANANADQIRVRGGVGVVDLEFGGTWTRDLDVTTRLAVGKLILRIPSDVGVRLDVQRLAAGFDHDGFVKRDDAWYSENWDRAPHKLRVRAETVFGKIDVRHASR
ncbi:MAG: cell wall-active antibiotics response protein [Gemmatimonadaceae bacterium]|nr:cell wall-active antibiotics response protein [Gemmatimonadaceae bacterium]